MIKLEMEYCEKEIYEARDNDQEYKEAVEKFKSALEIIDVKQIDNAVIGMETVGADVIYKKAFHDGMNFILKALAGKEVIEI